MKRIIREHLRKRVIVTLKTGEAFGGVLFSADSEALLLRDSVVLEAAGTDRSKTPIDGELLVLRPDIAYVQIP